MKIFKPFLYLLVIASSLRSLAHGKAKRVPFVPMQNCPQGCTCEELNCFEGKLKITCKEVGIICTNANITQNLNLLPKNTSTLSISGENMGHSTLDSFAIFPKLRKLSLKNNTIRSLRVSQRFGYLTYLNLDSNRLCFLPQKNLTLLKHLRELRLQYNNLTFVEDIKFPSSLTHLVLNHNHIESPQKKSFRRLKRLEVLQMKNNSIREIHPIAFRNLVNLQTLLLDYNQIRTLEDSAFRTLPSVSIVSLTNNRITHIDPAAFTLLGVKYHGFHQIHLEYNRIRLFALEYINILIPRAIYYGIYLAGNPIFCDCEMMLIRNKAKRLLRDLHKAECASPPSRKGVLLRDLDIDVNACSDGSEVEDMESFIPLDY